jgi:hypothetical protein
MFVVNVAWFFLSHRLPLARAAMAAGFRVHQVSGVEDGAEGYEMQSQGSTFHRVKVARGGLNPISEANSARKLRRSPQRVCPDIVHNVSRLRAACADSATAGTCRAA